MLSFEATVFALADTILRARCPDTYGGEPGASAPVARFLLATHTSMPDYLRLPFKILTLIFGLWSLPLAGATFHRLSLEARARQIRAWQESALQVRRDLVKFYETLTIFGWYAELHGQDYRHDAG